MSMFEVTLLIVILTLLASIFYLRYLGKKHNKVDWGNSFLNIVDGLFRCYCLNFHGLQAEKISLPTTGPALLISNHLSGIDPFVLIAACERPIRFMIAKEEYERFGLKWLFQGAGCIPVDRTGRADIAFRQAKRALDNGEVIALFPHGKIHLDQQQPYRVKPGIKRLAELSKVSIFIARITGVRGQGSVFKPLFLSSTTKIQQFTPIDYQFFTEPQSLQLLGELLLGHRESLSP